MLSSIRCIRNNDLLKEQKREGMTILWTKMSIWTISNYLKLFCITDTFYFSFTIVIAVKTTFAKSGEYYLQENIPLKFL